MHIVEMEREPQQRQQLPAEEYGSVHDAKKQRIAVPETCRHLGGDPFDRAVDLLAGHEKVGLVEHLPSLRRGQHAQISM